MPRKVAVVSPTYLPLVHAVVPLIVPNHVAGPIVAGVGGAVEVLPGAVPAETARSASSASMMAAVSATTTHRTSASGRTAKGYSAASRGPSLRKVTEWSPTSWTVRSRSPSPMR